MTHARHRNAGWQRSLIAFALILASIAGAAMPHRHALAAGDTPAPRLAVHASSAISAQDLTNVARDHERPCSACARQNGFELAPETGPIPAPRTVATLIPSTPALIELPGIGPNVCLRGPPSEVSVG